MPSTPTYAFPYPASTDSPNGPTQILALALALESKIALMDAATNALAALPKGYVGSHKPTAAVSSVGTTETVACVFSFNATAGRRYKVSWQGDLSSSGTSTTGAGFRLRAKNTASTTDVTGTIVSARDAVVSNGFNTQCQAFGDFVASVTGTWTVVATIYATNGTNNVTQAYLNTGHIPNLTIEDIGV